MKTFFNTQKIPLKFGLIQNKSYLCHAFEKDIMSDRAMIR